MDYFINSTEKKTMYHANGTKHIHVATIYTHKNIVEGPRIVRLAAVVDRGFKKGSALDVNVFGSVRKGDL